MLEFQWLWGFCDGGGDKGFGVRIGSIKVAQRVDFVGLAVVGRG